MAIGWHPKESLPLALSTKRAGARGADAAELARSSPLLDRPGPGGVIVGLSPARGSVGERCVQGRNQLFPAQGARSGLNRRDPATHS